jgi:D-inositol-3-phosphate glycosyltransferase
MLFSPYWQKGSGKMSNNGIAIIDNVGSRAGMNYYDEGLVTALSSFLKNVNVYSDYIGCNSANYHAWFRVCRGRKKNKALTFAIYLVSGLFSRLSGCHVVVLHVFETSFAHIIIFAFFRMIGMKKIAIVHDVEGFVDGESKTLKKILLSKLVDYLVVHNQYSKKRLQEIIASPNSISIIEHGNYSHSRGIQYGKEEAREKLQLDTKSNYLLFFGQIKKIKGLDVLLNALPKVPQNCKLIIAGLPWHNDFTEYQRIIERERIKERVILKLHFISDIERDLLFSAADICVLPYLKVFTSGVMLMSMSFGLPAMVSSIPPFLEVVDDGVNGLVFDVNDSDSLACRINRAFLDANSLVKIAQKAKEEVADRFSWEKIGLKYRKLIKAI